VLYYNEGVENAVSVGTLDLTDCIVLHNHLKSNGNGSFGEDDFQLIRDTKAREWFLVNEKYNYYAKKINSMGELIYYPYYYKALENADTIDDLRHYIFECLKEEGYIEYAREGIDKRPKR